MLNWGFYLSLVGILGLWLPSQSQAAVQYVFESPEEGAVAGVAVVRGWAFDAEGAAITRVELIIDAGEPEELTINIPCCSERPDVESEVQTQFPSADTLNSGWGAVFNWGNLTEGAHTVRLEIESADGDTQEETRNVTVVKPGGFGFLSDFSLDDATASIDGQELVLENVRVTDKDSGQEQSIAIRFQWFTGSQALGLVTAQTVAQAQMRLFRFAALRDILRDLFSALSLPAQAEAAIISTFVVESPVVGIVAGVSVVRGWVFDTDGAGISNVVLLVDGTQIMDIPCCSARSDVETAFGAEFPSADPLNSGWGAVINWGNFSGGQHTIEVRITSTTGEVVTEERTVTVIKPGGFDFIETLTMGTVADIEGQDIVLEGVQIKDKNSAETVTRTLRFRWDTGAQGLVLISQSAEEGEGFFDDFEDGVADGWTIIDGTWAVVDGEFAETSDASTKNMAISGPTMTDLLLTAQVHTTDDNDIGLIYRYQNADNFGVAIFKPQKQEVVIQETVGGDTSTLKEASGIEPLIQAIGDSRKFSLPVEVAIWVEQEIVRVFVNGRLVVETDEAGVVAGRIGLYSRSNKNAMFDDVQITDLDELESERNNTIYVDTANEGGTEDGTAEATAWGTIQEALADPRFRDSAGNEIVVKGGVYFEQVDVFAEASGIPGAFNTIRPMDGETVFIDGEGERVECVLIHTGVAYFRIEGLHLRNAMHRGILVFLSGPGELVNNLVYDSGDSGVEFWYGARNYTTAHNLIYRNGGHGVIIAEGSDPSRFRDNRGLIIRNNVILDNEDDGIIVKGDQPHTFVAYNNTIVSNDENGIFVEAGAKGGDVRNNIIVLNEKIGLKNQIVGALSRGYNTLFNNGASGTNNYDGAGGPGTDTVTADPLFVDEATGDFRLQAGSPSINTGDPATRFTDVDSSRNDMGAYGGPDPMTTVTPLP